MSVAARKENKLGLSNATMGQTVSRKRENRFDGRLQSSLRWLIITILQ